MTQVYFFTEGQIDIGYEMNKKIKYKVRLFAPLCLGGFECSFNRKCSQIYRANKPLKGFMIRKVHWQRLDKNYPDQFINIKMNNFKFYNNKIKVMISLAKQKDLELYQARADYVQIVYLKEDMLDEKIKEIAVELTNQWNNPENHQPRVEESAIVDKSVNSQQRYIESVL